MIAGIIQSPFNHSPFNNPERAQRSPQRRAARDGRRRLHHRRRRRARAAGNRSPWSRARSTTRRRTSSTTSATRSTRRSPASIVAARRARHLHHARLEPAALRAGRGAHGHRQRRRDSGAPQARTAARRAGGAGRHRSALRRHPGVHRRPVVQPVAVQPRRDRAAPGRLDLQAVRLSRARSKRRPTMAPATSRRRRSCTTSRRRGASTTRSGRRRTTTASTTAPSRCAARSRCRATSPRSRSPSRPATIASSPCGGKPKVGEHRSGKPYPSIALGVVELTPLELARGLHGVSRPRYAEEAAVDHARDQRRETSRSRRSKRAHVARPATAYLVTHMMRSVLNEGTGAGARGERVYRRCRRQVGHDQRSARRLVRRLHAGTAHRGVGRPRRQSAARPQRRAGGAADLDVVHEEGAGRHATSAFDVPDGVTFVEIDRDTGKIATPICPRLTIEAFLSGTEPLAQCELHRVQ